MSKNTGNQQSKPAQAPKPPVIASTPPADTNTLSDPTGQPQPPTGGTAPNGADVPSTENATQIDPKVGIVATTLLQKIDGLTSLEYFAKTQEINESVVAADPGIYTDEEIVSATTALQLVAADTVAASVVTIETKVEDTPAAPAAPSTPAEPVSAAPATVSGAVVASASDKVGAVVTAAAVAATVAAKAAPADEEFSEEAQKLIADLAGNNPALQAIEGLRSYIKTMKKGVIQTPQSGAAIQVNLYRTIQGVINDQVKDFPLTYATVLKIFDDHSNGVFGGARLFRFTEALALGPNDLQGFNRIMHLLMATAKVDTRVESAKHLDFIRSLQFGVTEEGRRRVLAFYNK